MTTQVTDRSIAPVFNMMNDMIANYTTGNIDTVLSSPTPAPAIDVPDASCAL